MLQSLSIWKDIVVSPLQGFTRLDKQTKIVLPMIILAVLLVAGGALQIPVVTSEPYTQAMTRASLAQVEKMGLELTDEMRDAIAKQQSSVLQRTIVLVSTLLAPAIGILIMAFFGSLYLLAACRIVKSDVAFKLLFKLLIFLAFFQTLSLLLNNIFLLLSDWESALANVNTIAGYQDTLVMNFSLAVFLDRGTVGNQLFYIINYLTNIFTVIFYIYCVLGLKVVAGLSMKQAVIISVIMAIGSMLIGLSATLFM